MNPIEDYRLPAQRRAILNYLVAAKGFEMNDGLMMAILRDDIMAVSSRAAMQAIEDWMAERGLVTIGEPRPGQETLDRSLTLTPLGLEVAQGISDIPGILRPSRAMAERMMRIAAGLEG
jgi:hypothetical protein